MGIDVKFSGAGSKINIKVKDDDSCAKVDSKGAVYIRGEDGAIFQPDVSQDGTLTWTNDKGLPNPEPVNIKGPKGDKGDTGARGPQGETGPQGARGPQGEKGEKGDKGDKGDIGPRGEQGPQGPQGIQGPQGQQGIQGPAGLKGDKGEQGPIGPKGDQGIQGVPGERGPAGEDGRDGRDGRDGYTPVKGEDYFTEEEIADVVDSVLIRIEKPEVATNEEIIEILIQEDMLPAVADNDGSILADENENILLW